MMNRQIPLAIQDVLNNHEVMFDVHCHIFTFKYVPEKFLNIQLPTTLKNGGQRVEHILESIIARTQYKNVQHIKTFFDIGLSKSIDDVSKILFALYEPQTIFCPLLMDMEWGLGNKPHIPYFDPDNTKKDQITRFEELVASYPGKFLPFIAIDPQNPAISALFERAFGAESKACFWGVKIYPALGYLPSDKRLMPLYEKCEALQIPITTHSGGGLIYSTKRTVQSSGIAIDHDDNFCETTYNHRRINRAAGSLISKKLNDPLHWMPVLKTFPKLKVNFAHFGGRASWNEYVKYGKNLQIELIVNYMEQFDNVYSDFSFNIFNPTFYQPYKQLLESNELVKSRSLYGSDFYMVNFLCDLSKTKDDFFKTMGTSLTRTLTHDNPQKFLFG